MTGDRDPTEMKPNQWRLFCLFVLLASPMIAVLLVVAFLIEIVKPFTLEKLL